MNCTWALERLELHLDGELAEAERAVLEAHLACCPRCAAELELARKVQQGLAALPPCSVPTPVTDAVYARARTDLRAKRQAWVRGWLAGWRPALGAGVVAAIVLVTALVQHGGQQSQTVSPEDIARAEAQVKWTLAYLSEVGRRTGSAVQNEVIGPHVVAPIRATIDNSAAL